MILGERHRSIDRPTERPTLPITGLIIWQGTIGQPHLPEMELPFPPSFESPDHPPPPRSLLRRYYPLVRSSSQFRLGTTATISATPVTARRSKLSLFLFFDRSRNEREQIGAKTRFFSPFFNSFGIFGPIFAGKEENRRVYRDR